MTFEPLIHHTLLDTLLVLVGLPVLVSVVVTGVTYFFARKSPDMKSTVISVAIMSFLVTLFCVGIITGVHDRNANKDAVAANISKKYDVEAMEFSTPDRGLVPEQSEAQEIKVKSHGKTQTVLLTQDAQTSEPTLLDFDNGKPLTDLLRK